MLPFLHLERHAFPVALWELREMNLLSFLEPGPRNQSQNPFMAGLPVKIASCIGGFRFQCSGFSFFVFFPDTRHLTP